ncbi:MAG: 5-deoxy-glucuronate isomerase [Gaiellaceae bacterium]
MTELLLKRDAWDSVTPASAGWSQLSFRVATGRLEGASGDEELCLVPLGGACRVEPRARRGSSGARRVFDGMPWALYLPRDTGYALETAGDVAICGARCERRHEPVLIRPEDVAIEVRGAGNATRQINHILPPEFPAERLLVVEVFTPAGNWSSYPPHKHDKDAPAGEVVLEETYYYRTDGFALQRLYCPERDVDLTETVRDGDLMLVPWGYHATCAAHGYDLYYLNALAGRRRSMAASDDPELAWVRSSWESVEPDPRVPLVS